MSSAHFLARAEKTGLYQRVRKWMNQGLVDYFQREVFAGRDGLYVAEVACGSGFASHLIAQKPQVRLSVAADINLDDYRDANMDAFDSSFVLMDIFHPATADNRFDLIWNSSSIEELEDPLGAVKSMVRLARPGGYVFIGVPHRLGFAGWLGRLSKNRYKAWLGRQYDKVELHQLLQAAGLKLIADHSYLAGIFIGALAQKN